MGRIPGYLHKHWLCRLLTLVVLVGSLACKPAAAYAEVREDDLVGGIPLLLRPIEGTPDVVAPSALVAAADGTILWSRGGTDRRPMASTTKIMTAVVALENAELDKECLVTAGAARTAGTTAWIQEHDRISLYNLLIGLLVPSGNDAGVAIAENIAGTQFEFVQMMNAKAQSLGMLNTHYVDAHGLDEDELYSTVEDYLILARHAMRNATFREIVCMTEATVYTNSGREIKYISTNKLFYRMEGVLGIKTGTNYEADACLVACVEHNGDVFYSVVFGSPTDESRYRDTEQMLYWAFSHYRTVELINSTTRVADLALTSWIDKTVLVCAAYPVTMPVFNLSGPISQEVELSDWEGSISRGQKVGRVIWMQKSEVIATADLVAAETIDAPNFLESVRIKWERFTGGFNDQPKHADTRIYLPEVLEIPF